MLKLASFAGIIFSSPKCGIKFWYTLDFLLGNPSIDDIYQFQTSELEGLGVSVYNQEEFEAGVMQQVDQAITLEEEMAAKQRAEKDMNAVLTDIR